MVTRRFTSLAFATLMLALPMSLGFTQTPSEPNNAKPTDAKLTDAESGVTDRDPVTRHVLVVVGPSNHPPGTHEVAAGGRLIAACLEQPQDGISIKATVVESWPSDDARLDSVDAVVMIG